LPGVSVASGRQRCKECGECGPRDLAPLPLRQIDDEIAEPRRDQIGFPLIFTTSPDLGENWVDGVTKAVKEREWCNFSLGMDGEVKPAVARVVADILPEVGGSERNAVW